MTKRQGVLAHMFRSQFITVHPHILRRQSLPTDFAAVVQTRTRRRQRRAWYYEARSAARDLPNLESNTS